MPDPSQLLATPNEAQAARIAKLTDLLGTHDQDFSTAWAPDLPEGWITVTIGSDKGRPKFVAIDENGFVER